MISNSKIKEKISSLKLGKFTCKENVDYFLSNIKKKDKNLNIIREINPNLDKIVQNLDKKREKKEKLGSLYGLCILLKSNISIKDMHISCASKTLENYKGTFDSDVVKRIVEEDGIILGIVNNDEFASGSSGEHSAFGPTKNPVSELRVPGGSSSGSAAAIAADFCDISLGSDTGGSIRCPASHCGIVGIKPSYGRVSRYGLVDLSMSLDQIGPFSRDLFGSELMLEVISGKSANDPTTEDDKVEDYTNIKLKNKYKVGIITEFNSFIKDINIKKLFESKISKLQKEGHEIVNLSIKNIDLAIQAYYPIVYTEFFSGTRKFDGLKYGHKIEDTVGIEALRRILGGKEISRSEFEGAYYKKALKVKEIISKEFENAFKKVDFLLLPVTPSLPHKLGNNISAQEMYAIDAFTIPANLAGICGGVVSKDKIREGNEEIYVGFQVFANKFNEKTMFEGLTLLENL